MFFIIDPISNLVVSIFSKFSRVSIFSRLGGTSFGLLTWDLSVKNLLNRLALSMGSSIITPSSDRGGIGTFIEVLVNFFKIENFFLELKFGSFQMFLRELKYLLASQSDAHTIAPHRDPSNPDPSHPIHL